MALTDAQKAAIEEVVSVLTAIKTQRKKKPAAEPFMDLIDRDAWPDYYDLIPEPRCINGVIHRLKGNSYPDPLKAYEDLSLVFYNALYYNEPTSVISQTATMLKASCVVGKLEAEWKQRSILPSPPSSPPPSSAQKVYGHPVTVDAEQSATSAVPSAVGTSAASTSLVPIAPAPAPSPAPVASVTPAASTPTRLPPLATQSTSPHRQSSPDMEIDVGGTPEPESLGVGDEMARDGESDGIVQQLERGLPRWEGFGDYGWTTEGLESRWLEIVVAIKGHKDAIGNRYSAALEAMPEESTSIPYLSFNDPLSLKLIESRARAKSYQSNKMFDREMAQLFEKARRWHEPGSDAYGHVLLLQRLYQAIMSPNPPPGPPYTSTTNFASLRAGPGTARPLHSSSDPEKMAGVTTFRVSNKDRTFVDEVQYKGWSVRLADWLHLSNPDDPSKPIVAQVFKCYVSDEPAKKGQPGVTVCWYHRPEQTFHPAHRQFWEGEVFKTSHFADHPVEDIIEKIACQFTARHIRGRPRPPYWYLGWPLYVCDSRYNDRERIFVKIKNWNSCVPEEVRKSTEFMPIYPFERMVFPRRFGSPFLKGKGVKGTGGLGGSIERADGERIEGGGTGRKRSKRTGVTATDISGPSKGLYVGDRVAPASGGAGPPLGSGGPYNPLAALYGQPPPLAQAPPAQPSRAVEDRSIVTAAGGLAALGGNAVMEKLPPETARHFDRDPETNEVLWFAAPPINVAHTPAPRYSLKYLHWLATKRKSAGGADEGEDESGRDDAMDVDNQEPASKRPKYYTATEALHSLLTEYSHLGAAAAPSS
ncbi:hypothetical protein FA95DRAFT_1608164 [Auriscalpium vulgare]|uniref:Uncharacterized protein n=1 Tax=Auriscalpium vulgare TaxID=40419 RepID=A0ACB8RLW7_9AGAM|nr:hypothetical protein FA95DRAFT_1608164 [Auriscalpium vulgare]